MNVLLLMKNYENDPENVTVLHKAYDIEGSSIGIYKSDVRDIDGDPYIDLEDEAYGVMEIMENAGMLVSMIRLQM